MSYLTKNSWQISSQLLKFWRICVTEKSTTLLHRPSSTITFSVSIVYFDLHAIQQFSFECPKTEPNLLFSANDNKRGQWNKRIKKNHVCFARENANEQKAIVFSFARLDENFARDLFFRSLRLVKDKTQISKSDQTWLPSSLWLIESVAREIHNSQLWELNCKKKIYQCVP